MQRGCTGARCGRRGVGRWTLLLRRCSLWWPSAVAGSRAEWAAAVGSLQRVIDVASAAQDAAIARLAAIEPEWLRGRHAGRSRTAALGHVALDAPAIVSGVLVVSRRHAERRVRAAVLLAADGPAGVRHRDAVWVGCTPRWARAGSTRYRAGGGRARSWRRPRRRCARPWSPLLRGALRGRGRCAPAAAVPAGAGPDQPRPAAPAGRRGPGPECGLRRWADEPGVDRWEGTFPSEDAARAWAAIDALARRYVADGACAHHRGRPRPRR